MIETSSATGIAARLADVRSRIGEAIHRAHREPDSLRLVLASKTQSADDIAAAYDAGVRDFGENYVQEAVAKHAALSARADIRWHLIGHLQTNKAQVALQTFCLIQTLDSARLASTLHRLHPASPFPVLVEVNVAGESSKSGVAPEKAEALIDSVRDQVEVTGLMTVPPIADSASARPYFARLRELRDRIAAASGLALHELSMGMTNDYEVAIEEGATIVRVGRAIFGERSRPRK
jgi:pyridoxal phosphate enzyme (YggS family)